MYTKYLHDLNSHPPDTHPDTTSDPSLFEYIDQMTPDALKDDPDIMESIDMTTDDAMELMESRLKRMNERQLNLEQTDGASNNNKRIEEHDIAIQALINTVECLRDVLIIQRKSMNILHDEINNLYHIIIHKTTNT